METVMINLKFYDYSHVFIDTSDSLFYELKDHFSYFAENYQFHPKFKYTDWDGKISLVDNDRLLPFGLVSALTKYAVDNDYKITISPDITDKYELSRDEFDEWINSRKYYSNTDEIYPYWYQLNAVYESLVNKRRILNLPTSAGKSLIQGLLTKYIIEKSEFNVLILVPTTGLVTQMKDDFVDYGLFKDHEIGEVHAKSDQKRGQRVVVSTWQSAIKKPKEWFNQFGMFMCDEMHLAIGKSISTIIKKLTHCEYKIGLSGSLRDGKANLMQYVGLFGGIYNPVTTAQLMDEGQVSKLRINAIFLKYPEKVSQIMVREKVDYQKEIKFITKLDARKLWVSKLAFGLSAKKENVFVMFKHIEHGKSIFDCLKEMGHTKLFYVSGEIDVETRNKIKLMAEQDSGIIIIASYGVFSTGISVKNLHHVILAHPVRSKVIVLQTVGRVLRKHKTKSLAQIWDIVDDMSMVVETNGVKRRKNVNYALKHAIERIQRYSLEKFDYVIKNVDFMK